MGCWSLDKTGDKKWGKKYRKVIQWCNSPTGWWGSGGMGWGEEEVGKYCTILPQKCWSEYLLVSKIMMLKKTRNDIQITTSDEQFSILFFHSFPGELNIAPKGPRSHCYLVWQVFWNALGRNVCKIPGYLSADVSQKTMASTNILLRKRNPERFKNRNLYIPASPPRVEKMENRIYEENEGKCFTF